MEKEEEEEEEEEEEDDSLNQGVIKNGYRTILTE